MGAARAFRSPWTFGGMEFRRHTKEGVSLLRKRPGLSCPSGSIVTTLAPLPSFVSPASSPDDSIGALLRCLLHRLFHRFLHLTSSAAGGVRFRNLASSLHLAQSAHCFAFRKLNGRSGTLPLPDLPFA